jgi:putative phage-type endonuclease
MNATAMPGPYPLTPEWHEARKKCIGASEAAAACGVSEWSQPLEIYLRKRGEIPEFEGNDATRLGTLLEPVVLAEYERRTGLDLVTHLPLFTHTENPFIGATPDSTVVGLGFPVEAKTTSHWRAGEFGDEGTDHIPDEYVMQAQQQMYVLGAERCDVAVLIDGRTLRCYIVRRNDNLIHKMVAVETELWQRIVDGNPPEPQWKHPATVQLLQSLHGTVNEGSIPLSDETAIAWGRYQALGQTIKEAEAERDACRARVYHALGDWAVGELPSGGAIRRSIVRESLWTEKDAEEITAKIGQVKRRSYFRLTERKPKA